MVERAIRGPLNPAAFAAGTIMLFQQTAAPTGWTKETTHNNKSLRLQTGSVTTGGGDSFTTVFGTGKATANFTLTSTESAAHTHTQRSQTETAGGSAGAESPTSASNDTNAGATASSGSGGAHAHTINSLDIEFVDVILATKD